MADKFLRPQDVFAGNGNMSYVNYETINDDNKEFLRNDMWEFKFTKFPNAVYTPGNERLQARLQSVQPQLPFSLSEMRAVIRQFAIRQTIFSGDTSGTITLQFVDREDQMVTAFINDWAQKFGDRERRTVFRKEDTVAQCELIIMNSTRVPIRKYTFYNCQIIGDGMATFGVPYTSDDAQQSGDCVLNLAFEHFKLEMLNDEQPFG